MIDVTTDGLTLSGTVGWAALLTYATLLAALGFSLLMLRRGGIDLRAALAPVQTRMGLAELPTTLFLIGGLLWTGLLIILTLGLYALVLDVLWQSVPKAGETSAAWDWRFKLVQITALTGVLGAVVALPFTLVRIGLTRAQNATAAESLFNDKINAATADLHAQRQATEDFDNNERFNRWEDDVIKRNAAIDRLEGLAEERPDTAPRIARMLSVYVRELSREFPAKVPPKDASPKDLREWARALTPARSDMEKAVQTLGRVRDTSGRAVAEVPIDLRGANLQGFDVKNLNFQEAALSGAHMQGADLEEAQLQEADLDRAQLQGADLDRAQLQGANLFMSELSGASLIQAELSGARLGGARLQGAFLRKAQLMGADLFMAELPGADLRRAQLQGAELFMAELQGADLGEAQFDASTSLSAATLRGAALREVDCTIIPFSQAQVDEAFGDASVTLGTLKKPGHWDPGKEPLDDEAFEEKWHDYMRSIGMDPANPA